MSKFYRRVVGNVVSVLESSVPITAPDLTEITQYEYQQASVPPALTNAELVAQAKARATQRTIVFANTIRERIANSKHYLQAARWSIQLAAAQSIKAGSASEFDTAIMAREARLRGLGETVDQLADKVLANSLIFASVGAAVDGIERATLDAIAAYAGNDPGHFETILATAKATGRAEFLDIFGAVYGPAQAETMATQFFGPLEVAE
jgi:hypothetical protein